MESMLAQVVEALPPRQSEETPMHEHDVNYGYDHEYDDAMFLGHEQVASPTGPASDCVMGSASDTEKSPTQMNQIQKKSQHMPQNLRSKLQSGITRNLKNPWMDFHQTWYRGAPPGVDELIRFWA